MLSYSVFRNKANSPWVTFIHGAGGSSSIWYKQIKTFSNNFNLLLVDLRGHGKSKHHLTDLTKVEYTFDAITQEVVEVLNHEKIKSSHFVGISLGTILIRTLAEQAPNRVQSMILGGAILKLNFRSKLLMRFGNTAKSIIPYMWLYKILAFIIMPNKNHKESRLLFVNEAKKLYQKEFIRWFKLTTDLIPLLKIFRQKQLKIPTLYVMGDEDYMFLPAVRQVVQQHRFSELSVIDNCGHVVNVEHPLDFNAISLRFLHSITKK